MTSIGKNFKQMNLLIIGIGGFLGAILRYLVSGWVYRVFGSALPWGTLAVNIIGSFILGFFFTYSINKMAVSPEFRNFISIGLLGAFTTFSTFSYETIMLMQQELYKETIMNISFNVIFCLIAALAGILIAKQF